MYSVGAVAIDLAVSELLPTLGGSCLPEMAPGGQ
jgi:hypothetical protein